MIELRTTMGSVLLESRRVGCVPRDEIVEALRRENNMLKREIKQLSRTREANAELQHETTP